jgi:hypothetical protein
VAIGVTLTTGQLRQVPAGWTFDSMTASTDRVTLAPGEKLELTVPIKKLDGIIPEAAVAYGTIIDNRVAPFEE